MAVLTPYMHVELNDDGVPMITGTTMKVIELVQEHLVQGWNVQELQEQHPYLSLGQIHSALSYYWDHRQALHRDIERRNEYAHKMQAKSKPIAVIQELKRKQFGK
jgi:uncharacterized protein (DUF433 family)